MGSGGGAALAVTSRRTWPRLTGGLAGDWLTGPHHMLTCGRSEAGLAGTQTPDSARGGLSLTLTPGSGCAGLSCRLSTSSGRARPSSCSHFHAAATFQLSAKHTTTTLQEPLSYAGEVS